MRSVQPQLQMRERIVTQLGPIAVAITVTALLLALLVALMVVPAAAATGNNVVVEAMAIDLKPEYETKDITVAYSLQVSNKGKVAESALLTLPVPPDAKLKGVYQMTENGAPEIPGASIGGGKESAAVSFATPEVAPGKTMTVYAMFTWNGIKFKGRQRSMQFRFQAPFDVPTAVMKVTEPKNSTNMVIKPEPAFRMGEGTPVSIIPLPAIKAGETLSVDLQYDREGGTKSSRSGMLLYVLGGVMIAALGFLLWRGTAASRAGKGA